MIADHAPAEIHGAKQHDFFAERARRALESIPDRLVKRITTGPRIGTIRSDDARSPAPHDALTHDESRSISERDPNCLDHERGNSLLPAMEGGRVLPETIDRIARYGLELIDELTGGPLVGASKVSTPDDADALGFAVGPSRWVFERLAGGTVHFQVDAAHYLPAALDLVVPASGPGLLTRVSMRPRSGYPFPPALPRVIGQVLFRTAHTPEYRIAVGARVRVGIRYRTSALPSGPVVSGPWLETRTADDGQYTMWFPRLDTGAEYEHLRCRVEVEVDTRSGVLAGDFEQEIQRSATTGLQTLRLGP